MGVTVRQKHGKWYVFINHKGVRKAKCVGSKRAAEDVKRQLEAQLILGTATLLAAAPPRLTFGAYAQQWLDTTVTLTCKPSTQRIFASMVQNQLLPAFGTHDLRTLSRPQVKTFVAEKARQYSPAYVRNIVRTLHSIYTQAIDDALVTQNPAAKLGRLLPEPRRSAGQQHACFTSAELARYLATMRERYPQHYAYFLTLARTGMREGEALGLQWDDLQFGASAADPHRYLHVRHTYDPVHKTLSSPKNGKSRRVDMSLELRQTLQALYAERLDQAILAGSLTVPPFVFCGASGQPLAASNLYAIHRRVCTAAGLQGTRIHDLRHSYATIQLYEHHAPIQYVSEQLGHASIKMTVDTYGHPRQGQSIHFADKLDHPQPRRNQHQGRSTYAQQNQQNSDEGV